MFLPVILARFIGLIAWRGKNLIVFSSFASFLLSLCNNSLEEASKMIINWNNHPKEEVSCEPSCEEEKASEANHLNQYRYHYGRYLGC